MSILSKEQNYSPIEYNDFYIRKRYFDDPDGMAAHVKHVIELVYPELVKFEPHDEWVSTTPQERHMANVIGDQLIRRAKQVGHINFIFRCEEYQGRRYFMFRWVNSVIDLSIVDIEFFA